MTQRSCRPAPPEGLHVALIMDGNGRWARARGLPRAAGHRAGAGTVRRLVTAAPGLGVGTLTLYAFSADNWRRPRAEVAALMQLFRQYLRSETARCVREGVRLAVIGRRDRFDPALRHAIAAAEAATADGRRLLLRIALDYSARESILRAAGLAGGREPTAEQFAELIAAAEHAPCAAPPVDLLVRTGGEQRLSDFLLWECAYAELLFLDRFWPDLSEGDLAAAVAEFHRRDRRFGGLADAATA